MTRTISAIACLFLTTGCATQAQLAGIAAKAKIPQECRFIGTTPEIADLGTKKNLQKVVGAMGGGNVLIVTGHRLNPGLAALANTWWGNLYDCENVKQYHGVDTHACGTGDRADVLRNRPPEVVELYAALETFAKSLGPVEFVTRERYVLLRSNRIFADLIIMSDALRIAIHLSRKVETNCS
jgi:Domain of unknown function (DUF5655)